VRCGLFKVVLLSVSLSNRRVGTILERLVYHYIMHLADHDLLLQVDKDAPKPFNWDRVLSITAILISLVAAVGALWQARIAARARKDILELAPAKPVIRIVGVSLQYIGGQKSAVAGITFTLRNAGKIPARKVLVNIDRHAVISEKQKIRNLMQTPESTVVADALLDGQEISTSPLGLKEYSFGDTVILSGAINYFDDSSWSQLPWCYEFGVPDPSLVARGARIKLRIDDCVGIRFPKVDSQHP
jgi:hypothetical protein